MIWHVTDWLKMAQGCIANGEKDWLIAMLALWLFDWFCLRIILHTKNTRNSVAEYIKYSHLTNQLVKRSSSSAFYSYQSSSAAAERIHFAPIPPGGRHWKHPQPIIAVVIMMTWGSLSSKPIGSQIKRLIRASLHPLPILEGAFPLDP